MVGGLLLSQVLTLYTTPVIYIFFDSLARRFGGKGSAPEGAGAGPAPEGGEERSAPEGTGEAQPAGPA